MGNEEAREVMLLALLVLGTVLNARSRYDEAAKAKKYVLEGYKQMSRAESEELLFATLTLASSLHMCSGGKQ